MASVYSVNIIVDCSHVLNIQKKFYWKLDLLWFNDEWCILYSLYHEWKEGGEEEVRPFFLNEGDCVLVHGYRWGEEIVGREERGMKELHCVYVFHVTFLLQPQPERTEKGWSSPDMSMSHRCFHSTEQWCPVFPKNKFLGELYENIILESV